MTSFRPIRCTCGYIWQRRELRAALNSGQSLVCPMPACAREIPCDKIEDLLVAEGEIAYEEPTQS